MREAGMSALPPLLAIAEGRRARPRKPANCEPRPRDRNAEARIQAAIVEWIRTVAPSLIVFHPANGGLRSKTEAARLKWIGGLAGVPDLVVMGLDGQSWLLEVKGPGGALSIEQEQFRDRCTALRIPFSIVRSIDDARLAFSVWNIPTRETSA
jgi:hypothetical protein